MRHTILSKSTLVAAAFAVSSAFACEHTLDGSDCLECASHARDGFPVFYAPPYVTGGGGSIVTPDTGSATGSVVLAGTNPPGGGTMPTSIPAVNVGGVFAPAYRAGTDSRLRTAKTLLIYCHDFDKPDLTTATCSPGSSLGASTRADYMKRVVNDQRQWLAVSSGGKMDSTFTIIDSGGINYQSGTTPWATPFDLVNSILTANSLVRGDYDYIQLVWDDMMSSPYASHLSGAAGQGDLGNGMGTEVNWAVDYARHHEVGHNLSFNHAHNIDNTTTGASLYNFNFSTGQYVSVTSGTPSGTGVQMQPLTVGLIQNDYGSPVDVMAGGARQYGPRDKARAGWMDHTQFGNLTPGANGSTSNITIHDPTELVPVVSDALVDPTTGMVTGAYGVASGYANTPYAASFVRKSQTFVPNADNTGGKWVTGVQVIDLNYVQITPTTYGIEFRVDGSYFGTIQLNQSISEKDFAQYNFIFAKSPFGTQAPPPDLVNDLHAAAPDNPNRYRSLWYDIAFTGNLNDSVGHYAQLGITTHIGSTVGGFHWDASGVSGATQDGGGVWNSATTNWKNIGSGGANIVWANNNDATFGASSGTAGSVTVNGTVIAKSLTFKPVTSGEYTLIGGAISLGAGGVNAEASATIASALNFTEQQVWEILGGNTVTLSGVITANGNALQKIGLGNVLLSAPNTLPQLDVYEGTVTQTAAQIITRNQLHDNGQYIVQSGTYTMNNNGRVSAEKGFLGTMFLNTSGSTAAAPDIAFLADLTGRPNVSSSGEISARLVLGSGNHYLTASRGYFTNYDFSLNNSLYKPAIISGDISGVGGITYRGNDVSAQLVLSGVNTFTGDLTIEHGSLHLVEADALNGQNRMAFTTQSGDDARLYLRGFDRTVKDLSSSGAGLARIANFPAANNGGTVPVSLTVISDNATTFGGVMLDTLQESTGNSNSGYGSGSAGALSLVKQGASTLTLTGTNLNTGVTTISAGTLRIGSGGTTGTLGTGAVVDNAMLAFDRSDAFTVSNSVSGAGLLAKNGSGTLTLSGASSYTGMTSVNTGTLNLTGSLGGTTVGVASGATITGTGTIGTPSANGSLIFVTGSRILSGTTGAAITVDGAVAVATGTLLDFDAPLVSGDTYLALNYTGALIDVSKFRLSVRGVATNATTTLNQVKVTASDNLALRWSGANSGAWGINDAANNFVLQSDGVTPDNFFQRDSVLMNDLALTSTVNATNAMTVAALTFDNTAQNYVVSGVALIVEGALTKSGAGTVRLALPLTLSGPLTINAGTLDLASPTNTTVAGTVSGAGTLRISGASSITLSGTNGYTGATQVAAGKLVLGSSGALGSTTGVSVATVAAFDVNGFSVISPTVTTSGTLLNGSSTQGQIKSLALSGDSILDIALGKKLLLGSTTGTDGALNLAGHTLTKNGAGTAIINGLTMTGAGDIVVNAGTLQLMDDYWGPNERATGLAGTGALIVNTGATLSTNSVGSLSLSMAIVLNGGTMGSFNPGPSGQTIASNIRVDAASFLNFTGGYDNVTFSGVISGAGALTINGGNATRTLSGTNTYAGNTTVNAGTLLLKNSLALQNSTLTTGRVAFDQTVASHAFTLGGLSGSGSITLADNAGTPNAVSLSVGNNNSDTVYSGVLSGAGSLAKVGTGALTLTGTGTYSGTTTITAGTLRLGDGGGSGSIGGGNLVNNAALTIDRSFSGTLSNAISGTGSLSHAGTGTTTLGGVNSFTGLTTVNAGTLALASGSSVAAVTINSGGALAGTGTVRGDLLNGGALNPGFSPGTLSVTGNYTQTALATLRVEVGSAIDFDRVVVTGSASLAGALNVSSYLGFIPTAGQSFTILTAGGGVTGAFSSILESYASLRIVTAYNANDVTLTFLADTVAPSSFTVWDGQSGHDDGVVQGGVGVWSAANNNWTTADGATNGAFGTLPAFAVFRGAGATVTVDDSAGDIAITGAVFSVNGYTLAVDALTLVNDGGTATLSVGDGTVADATMTATVASVLQGAANLTKAGAGRLVLTGANTYTGATTISAGTLQVGAGGTTGSLGVGAVVNDAVLVFNRSDTLTVANAISGAGTLAQTGTGTLVLAANNSYSGVTTISAGTLQIGDGGVSGTLGSGAVVNNAALVINRSNATTLGNLISGTGSFTQAGAGTTTLTAANDYTGVTTVTGGTLALDLSANANVIRSGNTLDFKGGALDAAAGSDSQNFGVVRVVSGSNRISNSGYTGTVATTGGVTLGALTLGGGVVEIEGLQVDSSPLKDADSWIKASGLQASLPYIGASVITNDGTDLVATNSLGNLVVADSVPYSYGAKALSSSASALIKFSASGDMGAGDNGRSADGVITLDPATQTAGSGFGHAYWAGVLNAYQIGTTTLDLGADTLHLAENGVIVSSAGSDLMIVGGRLTAGGTSSGASGTITVAGINGVTIGSSIVNNGSGVVSLTVSGPGVTLLTGDNTYTGVTTISAGTLQVGDGGTSGALGAGAVVNNAALVFNRSDSTGYTVANAISGTGTLTQTGTGTFILKGSNSYTGVTTISAGTLQVGDGGALGTGAIVNNAALVVNRSGVVAPSGSGNAPGVVVVSGNFALSAGGELQMEIGSSSDFDRINVSGSATLAGVLHVMSYGGFVPAVGTEFKIITAAGGVTGQFASFFDDYDMLDVSVIYNPNDVTLRFLLNPNGYTIANPISGIGSFTQSGAGTTTLTGTNTYTGVTTISAGTLQVGAGGTTGTLGTGAVVNDASLVFNRSDLLTVANAISGTGALQQSGTGTLVLTGGNSYAGVTTISAGTLQVGAGGTTGTLGAGAVVNNAALVFNRSDAAGYTVANVITGAGSITITGAGTTVLTGENSISGSVTVNTGSALQIGDGGLIGTLGTSSVVNNGTLIFNRSDLLTIFGEVTGSGTLVQDGTGTTLLAGNSTYAGALVINAGKLQIGAGGDAGVLLAGTVTLGTGTEIIIDRSGPSELAAAISGPGALVHDGTGTTTLTGDNTYTGLTTVRAGILNIGATSSTGAVTIETGGTLGGGGLVRGNLINGGTLSPGFSPGTIHVSGNFTQISIGTLRVELASATDFDRVVVTGAASLAGTLELASFGGFTPADGQSYTILTAGGGVTGEFTTVVNPFTALGLDVVYNPGDVTLLFSLDSLRAAAVANGLTPNRIAVAGGIDDAVAADPAYAALASQVAALDNAGFAAALASLSPQGYDRMWDNSRYTALMTVHTVENRLRSVDRVEPGQNIWMQVQRRDSHGDGDMDIAGSGLTGNGVVIGADTTFGDAFTVGAMFLFSEDTIRPGAAFNIKSRHYLPGIYASYREDGVFVDGVAGMGYADYTNRREVVIGGSVSTAKSDAESREHFVSGRAGYEFRVLDDAIRFSPYAGFQHTRWESDGFHESGAGLADLAIHNRSAESTVSRLGLMMNSPTPFGDWVLVPKLDLAWRHEFQESRRDIGASFGSSPFTVRSTLPARDGLDATVGLDVIVRPGMTVYASVSSFMDGSSGHSEQYNVGVNFRF